MESWVFLLIPILVGIFLRNHRGLGAVLLGAVASILISLFVATGFTGVVTMTTLGSLIGIVSVFLFPLAAMVEAFALAVLLAFESLLVYVGMLIGRMLWGAE